jgi:hypothetical protein
MNNHLLKNTVLVTTVTTVLAACGGTNEGFDPQFKADTAVEFDMPTITAELSEESGIQQVDLIAGATANGQPLSGNINVSDIVFTVDQNYVTPQVPTGTLPNQTRSPFTEEDGTLSIDTDMFSDRLSTCDTTDVRGGRDADNNVIGDGFPDNPAEVTYTINYAVDNGAPLPAGETLPRRTLELKINAVFDAVEDVAASDTRVLLGAEQRLGATVIPAKACEQALSYSVADESIATIDEQGNITTLQVGTTDVTITSVSDPSQTTTISLEVFSEFTIQISNQDFDANALPLGTKQVPSCTSSGIYVEPTPATGDSLSGDYVYEYTTSNDIDFPIAESNTIGFGGLARILTGGLSNIGSSFDVDVALTSGNTGETALEDVVGQTIAIEVVENVACSALQIDGVQSDYALDGDAQESGPGLLRWAPNNGNGGAEVTTVSVSDEALSGKSIALTRVAQAEDPRASFVIQGDFNTRGRNYNNTLYGQNELSIGRKFKYSVWVKLNELPTSDVVVRQRIVPWLYADVPAQQPGFNFLTRFPGAGNHSATLKATTDWQLVELIDEVSGTGVWTVPDNWNIPTPVFQAWEIEGLSPNQSVLLDEYSIIEVE